MMLAPSTILQDRYKIIRSLAAGGMGAVYEAIDQRLNAVVALKERVVEGDHTRRAFEREASLLANLSHPALPIVTDHFFEKGRQFLVMRYVPGDDLAQCLKERGTPFPVSDVLRWADQLLDVLEYLHNNSPPIIHRDIKPANLKLGEQGRVILLDFGLAKGALGQMLTFTGGRSVLGFTRDYAPLEQIHGDETDPRSDIYSLGATLYHLMTALVPVDASKRYCETDLGRPDPLSNASMINAQVPAALSRLLQRAMTLSRGERIPSAGEMRKALHAMRSVADPDVDTRPRVPRGSDEATLVLLPPPAEPLSPRQLKFQYWTQLTQILRNDNSVVRLRPVKPTFQVTGFVGHPQVQLFASASTEHNSLTVGVRILNRKDIYRALARERETIEAEINKTHTDEFRWRERKSVQTVSEITLTRQPDNIRWRERWPEYLAWHRDQLESFYKVFDPRVRKFSASKGLPGSRDEQLVTKFWEGFQTRLSFESGLIQLNKPYIPLGGGGKSWRNKSLARAFRIAVQLNASKNYVDVNITVRPAQYELFVEIYAQREIIERELGFAVEWKLNAEGESWVITKQAFSLADAPTWKQTYEWLLQNLRRFLKVFSPRIQGLSVLHSSVSDRYIAVVKAYVCDGWSHRRIEREILGLPAPERGGGYQAMSILRQYGITGEHKSCLEGETLNQKVFEGAGTIQEYLRQIKG